MNKQRPDLFRTMYTMRALRRFKPDPISEEVLFQLFDAAIRAPSGQNVQDWRFIIVTDPAVKRSMQAWAGEGWARYQPEYAERPELMDALPRTRRLSLRSVEHLVKHLAEVPAVIVVCGLAGATPHLVAAPSRPSRTSCWRPGRWDSAAPSSICRWDTSPS